MHDAYLRRGDTSGCSAAGKNYFCQQGTTGPCILSNQQCTACAYPCFGNAGNTGAVSLWVSGGTSFTPVHLTVDYTVGASTGPTAPAPTLAPTGAPVGAPTTRAPTTAPTAPYVGWSGTYVAPTTTAPTSAPTCCAWQCATLTQTGTAVDLQATLDGGSACGGTTRVGLSATLTSEGAASFSGALGATNFTFTRAGSGATRSFNATKQGSGAAPLCSFRGTYTAATTCTSGGSRSGSGSPWTAILLGSAMILAFMWMDEQLTPLV